MTEYITKSELRELRDWTETGIRRFLGEPDEYRPNPYYRTAAPMCLYELARVKAVEASPEFLTWRKDSEKRRDAAYFGALTKEINLRREVESWEITVPVIDRKTLATKAIANYYGLQYMEASGEDPHYFECYDPHSTFAPSNG